MKRKPNYGAERAERIRKKAEKKEARLAALSGKEVAEAGPTLVPANNNALPKVHRPGD
jgi:hypothetical protein